MPARLMERAGKSRFLAGKSRFLLETARAGNFPKSAGYDA